ncbi:acrylyl-CoA reductase (NADPH) [Silvimonas iriomotensis]|uniref:Zinc-binding dehydrogenase n=1 Tax=Silvimonas iriomotensis TaxID=449662 RepID=A0ABQ2P4Q3_9NEIS|nr:MDR family oxidoreductase [Silvimonas iriomotensis]GGP18160.1 zinc-binding dehydrogenase [Silvimonas iriomotensis]
MFKALLLSKEAEVFSAKIAELDQSALPVGNVDLDVEFSTLNYKDALAIGNASPIVRQWPMVPGVDGAGVVTASSHPDFQPGDRVVLNGWGVGEKHWGCLAQKARLNGDWLIPLPTAFTAEQAMAMGTAGYTAALCVLALAQHGLKPEDGPVLVTGATGGVGSFAIALLARAGYQVTALTGKPESEAYLKQLGATAVLDRQAFAVAGKPLQKETWAGVVDSAGSHTLANACAQVRYGGAVAACGLAQGMDFPATVAPFILRGVTLYGVDSVMAPKAKRLAAWARLAADVDVATLNAVTTKIGLADCPQAAAMILQGKHQGRFVVDVNR